MRSMTGYGRAEVVHAGKKFSVELNSVNRKQSDIVVNLPRHLTELEPRIRQTINENISRGRTNVLVCIHNTLNGARRNYDWHHLAGTGGDARTRRNNQSAGSVAGGGARSSQCSRRTNQNA